MHKIVSVYGSRDNGLVLPEAPGAVAERIVQRDALKRMLREQQLDGVQEILLMHQVHGADIRIVRAADADYIPRSWQADAVITTIPAYAVGVLTADCVPLILYDASLPLVAAVHAGWRGLQAGIIEQTVAHIDRIGVSREQLRARIGPAAGVCCYQVTEPFAQGLSPELRKGMVRLQNSWYFDLVGTVIHILTELGITLEAAESCIVCTICSERYHSYRRQKEHALRNVTLAWIQTLR